MPTPRSEHLEGLRILQVGPLYNNHLRRWSANASALGCRVFAAGHVRAGRRPVELGDIAERVDVAPESPGRRGQAAWLNSVIERVEPDLIQAHWLPRWGYLAVRTGNRPVAVTAWGSDVYRATGEERRRADSALLGADRVITRSEHMRRELLDRGVAPERIAAIDLGVDLDRFKPASAGEQAGLRAELRLPSGPVILSMRAGTPLYNLDVVLDAFQTVRAHRREPPTLVLVHGDAPLSPSLRTALRGRDGVHVLGRISHEEMPKYLRAATVGISIPDSDGSPSSVWEALACGLPLVLSDLPQVAEKTHGSPAVRLVAPGSEPVAAAVCDLLDGPRHDQARMAARTWATQNVDQREQIARLGRLYETMRRARTPGREPGPHPHSRSARGRATAAAPARPPS